MSFFGRIPFLKLNYNFAACKCRKREVNFHVDTIWDKSYMGGIMAKHWDCLRVSHSSPAISITLQFYAPDSHELQELQELGKF